jgi:hypothetical protein
MSYNRIVKHRKLPRFSKNQGEFKEVPQYTTIRGGYSSFIGGGTNNNIGGNYTSILGGPPNNFMIGNNTTIDNTFNNTMVIGDGNNRIEFNDNGITMFNNDNLINLTNLYSDGQLRYFDDGKRYGVSVAVGDEPDGMVLWSKKHKKSFKEILKNLFKRFKK